MKVGLNKRSFWSKSFVLFCLAGRVRYDPAVTRAQLAGCNGREGHHAE
jgi:hypothetical protein